MRSRHILAWCSLGAAGCFLLLVPAQRGTAADQDDSGKKPQAQQQQPRETVSKPLTEKQRKKNEAKLRKELESPYKKWLNEEVVYIISDEERKAFNQLQTDEEREQFIEDFWKRRDPTPDTEENEFREEHYRRLAYANERFASGEPGWKTDRGMIYIKYGPPDEIDDHSSGGTYERPIEEGGGETSTFPFVDWRYRYIPGVGQDVNIEFVDTTMTGEFHMTMDPSEKDALTNVPGAGLTLYEQLGLACKADRFTRTDGTRLGTGAMPLPASMDQFTRLEQFTNLQKAPAVKFKDLEEVVNSSIKYNLLPMEVQADYIPVTDSSVLVPITVQFNRKDLQFKEKDNLSTATVNIFGRITTLTRRTVQTFEDVVSVDLPTEMLQKGAQGPSIYQKTIPLAPGRYRLDIVAKDVVGGNQTTFEKALEVPHMDDDHISSSSLILADTIEKVPTHSIGTGMFVIGTSKVRPRMNATFKRDEKMGIYLQLYNFGPDQKTHKPDGTIQYEVVKDGSNDQPFPAVTEQLDKLQGGASQITIEKLLPLQQLPPGKYTLKITVTDKNRNQTLTQSAGFTVT